MALVIYKAIKARRMKLCESPVERQLRHKKAWNKFYDTKNMSAHQSKQHGRRSTRISMTSV